MIIQYFASFVTRKHLIQHYLLPMLYYHFELCKLLAPRTCHILRYTTDSKKSWFSLIYNTMQVWKCRHMSDRPLQTENSTSLLNKTNNKWKTSKSPSIILTAIRNKAREKEFQATVISMPPWLTLYRNDWTSEWLKPACCLHVIKSTLHLVSLDRGCRASVCECVHLVSLIVELSLTTRQQGSMYVPSGWRLTCSPF